MAADMPAIDVIIASLRYFLSLNLIFFFDILFITTDCSMFKTSRPKSALIINEACEKGFFYLEKTAQDQRKKNIKPTESFVQEFEDYLKKLKEISF